MESPPSLRRRASMNNLAGRVGRAVALVLAGGLGLFLLALGGFLLLVDPARLAASILEDELEDLGQDIQVEGQIRTTFTPWLGVELEGLRIPDPAGGDLLTLRKALLHLRPLPLLRKELHVERLELEGVTTLLDAAAWRDVFIRARAAEKPSSSTHGDDPTALRIQTVRVRDAVFLLDRKNPGNDTPPRRLHVLALDATAFQTEPGRIRCRVEGSGQFRAAPDLEEGHFTLGGDLDAQRERQQIRLDNCSLAVQAQTGLFPGKLVDAVAQMDLVTTLHPLPMILLDRLRVSGLGVSAAGQLHFAGGPSPLQGGDLRLDSFNPRVLLTLLGLPLPSLRNPEALSRLEGRLAWNATPGRLDMPSLALRLDDTAIVGSLHREDGAPLRLTLALDALDLARYAPGPSLRPAEGPPSNAPLSHAPLSNAPPSPASPPTTTPDATPSPAPLSLAANLTVASLRTPWGEAREARLPLRLSGLHHGWEAHMEDARVQFLGGTVQWSLRLPPLRGAGDDPVTLRLTASDLDGAALGKLLSPEKTRLTGQGEVTAALDLPRAQLPALLASFSSAAHHLTGSARATLRDGAVANLGAFAPESLRPLLGADRLAGLLNQLDSLGKSLPFSLLSATVGLARGVAASNDVQLAGSVLSVSGKATARLGDGGLSGSLKATLPSGLTLPLELSGTVARPDLTLDVSRLLSSALPVAEPRSGVDAGKALLESLSRLPGQGLEGLEGLEGPASFRQTPLASP